MKSQRSISSVVAPKVGGADDSDINRRHSAEVLSLPEGQEPSENNADVCDHQVPI